MPTGDVTVGAQGLRTKFQSSGVSLVHLSFFSLVTFSHKYASATANQTRRQVHQRLLTTPDALPARTMCVDQVVSEDGEPSQSVRSLLVLKRRAADGLVTSLTEEEGHRRVSSHSPSLNHTHSETLELISFLAPNRPRHPWPLELLLPPTSTRPPTTWCRPAPRS